MTIVADVIAPRDDTNEGYRCELCDVEHQRVTKMIDATCPKYALVPWAEKVGRKAGWRARAAGVALEDSKAYIQKEGLDCETQKLAGGSRGTELHDYLSGFISSGELPPLTELSEPVRPYGKNLARFLLDYEPEFKETEFLVVHHKLDYAGKCDGIATIGTQPPRRNRPFNLEGKTVLFDLKTNREGRVYPPAHYFQVAAYEYALRDMGHDGTDHQVVLAVGEESYQLSVSYYDPNSFVQLATFHRTMKHQAARNPNARGRSK